MHGVLRSNHGGVGKFGASGNLAPIRVHIIRRNIVVGHQPVTRRFARLGHPHYLGLFWML